MIRRLPALAAAVTALALLAGCGTTAQGATGDGRVRIVASTDVYGSIAKTVGGSAVTVTSIIDSPDKDPHEYESTARDTLAVRDADLVIENGAGYDDFMSNLLSASGSKAPVLNVATISGYDLKPADGEFNEHLWYDYPTMVKLVARIQAALATAAPKDADAWTKGGTTAQEQLAALQQEEGRLKSSAGGKGVAITEPVPLYALDAIGLLNRTPEAFSAAIEEGTDAPARVLQETLALFSDRRVALLVYNEQTGGPQTDAVLRAAKAAGIPAVGVTETLPRGEGYAAWQTRQLDEIGKALAG